MNQDKSIIRCPICFGYKTIKALGNLDKPCHNCNGVGYLNSIEIVPMKAFDDEIESTVDKSEYYNIIKKRGRPKKNDN